MKIKMRFLKVILSQIINPSALVKAHKHLPVYNICVTFPFCIFRAKIRNICTKLPNLTTLTRSVASCGNYYILYNTLHMESFA